MKLTILQQDLISPLQAVARSCGIKSTLPVLANILLQTESGKLKLSATNLELGVIKKVNANISEDGEITVPSRTFLEIISSLTDAEISLESSNEQLKISSKNFDANLNCISASEFPAIPLASDKSIQISAKILQNSIPQISFAAASDEGRPTLTGILTQIKKDSLELVATDGFRLAHKTAKIESGTKNQNEFKALIPRRTFEEVVRLISEDLTLEEDGLVEISTSENQNQMIFKIGSTQLSSRLIEGNFPSWEKIIPQTSENKTVIDREPLLKAVKLASVFSRGEANIIKIETLEGKIRLLSEAKELGGQQSVIDAQTKGAELTIAFNSKFLIDALSAFQNPQINIEFSGALSPALIKPVGEEGLEYVVMPIRLS